MELDDLIDEIEDVLADGRRVPFSGRLLVDEERLLDIIDRMRVAVPEQLRQARRVVQEQDRLLGEAHDRVRQALSDQGLLAEVEAERARLLGDAQAEAAQIRAGADAYAHDILEELEARLDKWLGSVRVGMDELKRS